MTPFSSLGKLLISIGAVLVLAGLALTFFHKIPLFGKLPGDIVIRKKDLTIYVPIATSIVLSVVVTILLNIFGRK
jgi:hypothetical protein